MASGNYAKKAGSRVSEESPSAIPARATRQLQPLVEAEKTDDREAGPLRATMTKALQVVQPAEKYTVESIEQPRRTTRYLPETRYRRRVIDAAAPDPIERHRPWLKLVIGCMVAGVVFAVVLISAAIQQRPGIPQLITSTGGGVYSIQVGGSDAKSWQEKQPMPAKTAIPVNTGPYSVLGKPTISAAFINQVLASYNSPAAGKGQALYDLGIKYGIDPAFALAFFQHESTFGTQGEARTTFSLGNLRCIPDRPCVDQDRGGYAQMQSWEDGFEIWYQLIRNYYIARRGLLTVDQIIPVYAPTADNNNEQAYIASLKHSITTWHAGVLRP